MLKIIIVTIGFLVVTGQVSTAQTPEEQPPVTTESNERVLEALLRNAEHGDVGAQFSLGWRHASGRGAPQDYAKAAHWYRKAAEQGNSAAQFDLGRVYYRGRGFTQDDVLAHMWFDLSASAGDNRARSRRDIVARRMTQGKIVRAQRLAREWTADRQ